MENTGDQNSPVQANSPATPPELVPPPSTQSNADPSPAVESGAPAGAAPSGTTSEAVAAPPPAAAVSTSPKAGKARTDADLERTREQTRKRVQAFRAKKKQEAATKPAEDKKPDAPPELTKKQEESLERDVRRLIDAMWLCGQIIAGITRRELEDLEPKELDDGVRAWMPVARKHTWLLTLFGVLTAPLWLVQMIRRKLRRRAEDKKAPPAKPAELAAQALPPPQAPAPAQSNGPGNVVTLPTRRSAAAAAAAEDEERRRREERGQ